MRAALFLLLGAVVVAGILHFYPSSVEGSGGAASGAETDGAAGRFLTRPDGGTSRPPVSIPAPIEEPAAAPVQAQPSEGAPAPSVFGIAWEEAAAEEDELSLAAAQLYGDPARVALALEGRRDLEEAEHRFHLSFAQAMAGQRKEALTTAQGLDGADVLSARDRLLLQAALGGADTPAVRPASASRRGEGAVRYAMELKLLWREAHRLLGQSRHKEAAAAFSELFLAALAAPFEAERGALVDWTEGIRKAQRRHRWNPKGDWAGVEMEVQAGDTLTHIRKRFLAANPDGMVCTGLIAKSNGVVGYLHEGQRLRVPTDRAHTLVDLSSRWLLYLIGDEVAGAWEVGIGRAGEETIVGTFLAGDKQMNPMWFPRGQAPVPNSDPENPLGTRWIGWYRDGNKTGYGFHGTRHPESIGQAASDGCVRMRNEEVEELFEILPIGAAIQVQE